MRELIVTEFITLDGVMGDPAWTFTDVTFDPAAYELKGREQSEAGALLVGRKSWQEFEPVWPSMTDEFELYNAMPKYVVSTTLDPTDVSGSAWQPTTLLRSIDEVRALKETGGDPIIVHGSCTLAQSLAAAGLVDRYHLLIFPVILGSGLRLFADDAAKQTLHVLESETYGNGVTKLVLTVRRDADLA